MRAAWWWIDRWRTSSAYANLSMAEQGAYRNLLDELWLRDGMLPEDDRSLERASGAGSEWPKLRGKVMTHFTKVAGGYRHDTHDAVQAESEKRAERQKRYRDSKRNVTHNVTGNVPPDVPPSLDLSLSLDPSLDRVPSEPLSARADLPPLAEAWNRIAEPARMAMVTTVKGARARHIKTALADEPDLAVWGRAFRAICSDKFCRGTNDRGWKADFDYAIRPEKRGKWLDEARAKTDAAAPNDQDEERRRRKAEERAIAERAAEADRAAFLASGFKTRSEYIAAKARQA